jgi:RNA polymerase sigma-70 factor (ECF subfamily)
VSTETRQLVAQCLAGHSTAIAELMDRYQRRVYALCYRMLGQTQDAEDAQQETFIRALRSLARWNPGREFEPWLLAIAANRCRTMLTRRSRYPALVPWVETPHDHAPSVTRLDLREELSRALNALRPEYRQAFSMFHQDQYSYQEISRRMGRPVGTVKAWVHRARLELVDELIRRGCVE